MPAREQNINAFDLKLLKSLINLKINKNHTLNLSTWQKRELCKNYSEKGIIEINDDYFVKVLPKEKEISHSITLDTLDQLCSILKENYRWYFFIKDIGRFRPGGINDNVAYIRLAVTQRKIIDSVIEEIFKKYKSFKEFEKEVIDEIKKINEKSKNQILNTVTIIHEDKTDPEIKIFANRIYIELTTRKAAIPIDENNDLIEEIYNSWYKLFCIIRDEMKTLPIKYFQENFPPAIELAMKILNEVLRPHLTEHQGKFRSWLENARQNSKYKNITPQELQKKYSNYISLINSMKEVNKMLIDEASNLYILANRQ